MGGDRQEAFSNFAWKLAEQIGAQAVSFAVSIILARLLMPDDYSVVSIVAILAAFCSVVIDGGLSKSLIQKKDSDILDYSTVLVVSIALAGIFYAGLFVLAPLIAGLYSKELLIPIIRVYALCLFIGAFNTVQNAYISKNMQFKKYFLATIVGTVISAVVGIWMAYSGMGAWALVAQQLTNSSIDTLLLYITTDFRPQMMFSLERLKKLWNYGIKVLGTSMVDMLYENIRPLIVGLKFNATDLAYYQKGKSYPNLINATLNSTLSAVLFPVMAKAQDDCEKVKLITQKYIRVASYLVFPSLLGLAAIAPNLIVWMITDKWVEAVPYMQVFCVNYMFMLLQTGNLQAINAVGRSDVVLKLAVIKKSISFLLLFALILFSKTPLLLAAIGIVTSLIAFFINATANQRILKYGFGEQIGDILPNLIISFVMAAAVYCIGRVPIALFPLICLQLLAGVVIYVLLSVVFHNPSLFYCIETLKGYIHKGK